MDKWLFKSVAKGYYILGWMKYFLLIFCRHDSSILDKSLSKFFFKKFLYFRTEEVFVVAFVDTTLAFTTFWIYSNVLEYNEADRTKRIHN